MRCRVFIRGLPKSIKPTALRELLEEQTDGCGEVLLLRDPENQHHNQGYALASYESFALALEACSKQVVVDDTVLTLNVVDRPKPPPGTEGSSRIVTDFEFFYKPTIEIDGVAVQKTDLVHSYGLQRALRSYTLPRWCHWTARGLDCELGEQCNFIHRKSCQVTVYPRKRPRELQMSLLPSQVIPLFHEDCASQQLGKWYYRPVMRPTDSGSANVVVAMDGTFGRQPLSVVLTRYVVESAASCGAGGCVVGLSTYLPVDAFLNELDDLGERSLAHRVDLAVEAYVGPQGKRLERFHAAILALVRELGDWLCVRDPSRALALLQKSKVFLHASQDTDAALLIRPWYPLSPGCDLDVWVRRGSITKIAQAYRQLYVPQLVRHERAVEAAVVSCIQAADVQSFVTSPSQDMLLVRVGVAIKEGQEPENGTRIDCYILRVTHSTGEYNARGGSNTIVGGSSTLLDLCLEPSSKLLAELPQEWIDFIRRRCLSQH